MALHCPECKTNLEKLKNFDWCYCKKIQITVRDTSIRDIDVYPFNDHINVALELKVVPFYVENDDRVERKFAIATASIKNKKYADLLTRILDSQIEEKEDYDPQKVLNIFFAHLHAEAFK